MLKRAAGLVLLACLGCAVERHYIDPGNQVLRVESGDRIFLEMDENRTTGYSWEATCADSDVDVTIRHIPGDTRGGVVGATGRADVEIRVHRGYDGPSTVRFRYVRPWEKDAAAKEFTVTLFKRTGDSAFWE